MIKVAKTGSYRKVIGKPFDPKNFPREVRSNDAINGYSYFLDFGDKTVIDVSPGKVVASVKTGSYELKKTWVEKYMEAGESVIRHMSPSHELDVKKDGTLSLDFRYRGKRLDRTLGDVYYGMLKSPAQVRSQVKEWSDIAANLGLNALPPQSIKMDDDCEALKICTQFNKVEEGKVQEYVTGVLLKELKRPGSKLEITSMAPKSGSSKLAVDADGIGLETDHEGRLGFFFEMTGKSRKDPMITYNTTMETRMDRVQNWVNCHENEVVLGSLAALLPVAGAAFGGLGGMHQGLGWEYAKGGALVGGLIDTAVASIGYGIKAVGEWLKERELAEQAARRKFMKFADDQSHLKPDHGSCVVLTTKACALKAAYEKPKKEKSGNVAAFSVLGMPPEEEE